MKKLVGVLVACISAFIALSGCEVTQINWANHAYTVGPTCMSPTGTATLRNGTGIYSYPAPYRLSGVSHVRVTLAKTLYGDFTADGVNDVVTVLVCTDADGGNAYSSELQVFTRDGKPVQRLTAPGVRAPGEFGLSPQLDVRSITDHPFWGVHYIVAGVYSYAAADPRCCPSSYTTYWFQWDSASKVFRAIPWHGFP